MSAVDWRQKINLSDSGKRCCAGKAYNHTLLLGLSPLSEAGIMSPPSDL